MYRPFGVVMLACFGIAYVPPAAAQALGVWGVTGSGHPYGVQGTGDLLSERGATERLRAQHADPDKFGASITMLDALPYRDRTIRLSADLDAHDVTRGVAIWLRADDAAGKPVAFANSEGQPLRGTASAAHREVQIDVPTAAARLVLGTILHGNGEVTARHLRLAMLKASPGTRVAPEAVLDAAISIVQAHALRAKEVDWDQLKPALHAMTKDAKTPVDVYPAIHHLLAALDDHHSFLMAPRAARQNHTSGGPTSPPSVELKPDSIGYIGMPGYVGMQAQARHAFVAHMVAAIGKLAPQARCGWVVDLRRDTGGNMLPMLAGLRPLLGDESLGGFRPANGNVTSFGASNVLDKTPPRGPELEHAPVAVLLGPHTASSGEVVAVAFRGRANTRSFGQPTAGLSTGNAGFALPDGSIIFLTTAVDVDRNGHAYGGKIMPDQIVDGATTAASDPTLGAAHAWLVASCAH
ncbi:MAG: S41 family peptidase [Rhodanobacter sp.]